jgi:hypothetical protein
MAALGFARESEFFHSAQRVALSKHVGKLVDNGLLPQSALAAIEGANPNAVVHSSGIPTTVRSRPPAEFVYNHVQSLFPMPKQSMASKLTLGTGVSFGRARWGVDGASVFSVADGKALAQTEVKVPTAYERLRADRVARQQLETPLVRGVRLLPVFSPGRAFFWGSILALWGTAGTVLSIKRGLGVERPEDVSPAVAAIVRPISSTLRRAGERVRSTIQSSSLVGPSAAARGAKPPEYIRRMRAMFQ